MLTLSEKAPLQHLRLSELGMVTAAALFLGGLWMLMLGPEKLLVLSVALVGAGIALGFIAGYYRGCRNGSCTPNDW